jgi:hypothetical protein
MRKLFQVRERIIKMIRRNQILVLTLNKEFWLFLPAKMRNINIYGALGRTLRILL